MLEILANITTSKIVNDSDSDWYRVQVMKLLNIPIFKHQQHERRRWNNHCLIVTVEGSKEGTWWYKENLQKCKETTVTVKRPPFTGQPGVNYKL
jgi:hypothetical protein